MGNNSYTYILLKRKPSFLEGMASLLDFSTPQEKYNYSKTDTEADCRAIRADWMAIGGDMNEAFNTYVEAQKPLLTDSQ
jgi:hypothetical protein